MTDSDYFRYRRESYPGSPMFRASHRRIDFRHKPPSPEAAAAIKSQSELAKQRRASKNRKQ